MGGTETLILLDTHVLIWLDEENAKLGRRAESAINRALAADRLGTSAIAFWEIGMLAEKGRIKLDVSVELFRQRIVEGGVREIALDGAAAIAAARLGYQHGDPADRLIIATAQAIGATLVTADDRILDWRGPLKTIDARV